MDIYYTVKTDHEFTEAVTKLKDSLNRHQFGVLWELNFKDKLKEKNLDFESNLKILEVCNPKQAKEVLEKQIEAGFFLPCKMVVYEQNGFVYMGMLKPTQLISMVINDDLTAIAEKVENVLKLALDEAK